MALCDNSTTCQMGSVLSTVDVYFYIDLYIFIVLTSIVSVGGVITNIVNVLVYIKCGVSDSISVTFIALSLWEACNSLITLMIAICDIIERFFPVATVSFVDVQYAYFLYTRGFLYIGSAFVNVYLSVERCICVVIPLKVKGVFTKSRSVIINVCILFISLTISSLAWATQGLQWRFDPEFNRTRLVLWLADNRHEVMANAEVFAGVALPATTQIIITVNSIMIVSVVKASTRFRHTTANHNVSMAREGDNRIDKKDARLAKIVIWINVIYFVCNLPLIIHICSKAIIPDTDAGESLGYVFQIFASTVVLFAVVNSNAYIFIYYAVSTRYRQVFISLFTRQTR